MTSEPSSAAAGDASGSRLIWLGIGSAAVLTLSAFMVRMLAHRLESEWSYLVGIAALSTAWTLIWRRLQPAAAESESELTGSRAPAVLSTIVAVIGVCAYLAFLTKAGVSKPNADESASVPSAVLRLVVLGPLLEEVYWRRYFLRACGQIWRSRIAVVFTSTVWFCVGHAAISLPVALIVGLINSMLVVCGAPLSGAVLVHAAVNAVLLATGWAR